MKRVVKNILRVTACLFPIGLIVGFSTNWSRQTPISCVGSSGVMPFVQSLAKSYDSKSADITVEAGGSGFGTEQVAKGFATVGDASANQYSAVKDGFQQEWTNRHIKSVTIGWEAICMVYIPPSGISGDVPNDLLYVQDVTDTTATKTHNINNLLRIFSGYTTGLDEGKHTLGMFANSAYPQYQSLLDSVSIVPYVRTGGALVSGTAKSFYNGSHFDDYDLDLTQDQKDAFGWGNYGNDIKIYPTDEANSRAWDMFSSQNIPGSMVYLSSGFIEQNKSLIKSKHYGIMAYKKSGSSEITPYNINDVDSKYNWFRPLNLMLSCDGSDLAKNFIEWLLTDGQNILADLGAKKLETDELHSMYAISDYTWDEFWLSNDVAKAGSNVWITDQVFGAVDQS